MDSRLALQITLGVLGCLILLVGGLIIHEFTREAETVMVPRVVQVEAEHAVEENPWASQENREAAIRLVQRYAVELAPPKGEREPVKTRVDALLKDESFVRDKLKITKGEPAGWTTQWWGETQFGPQFYLVQYDFKDTAVGVGPAWLVDLKAQKIVAKNVLAEVTLDPDNAVKSAYYDKAGQVISAVTNHRFDSGVNLGGALLLYFAENVEKSDDDTIIGWTIAHDRGNKFDAFFQWTENQEPTYAEFQFDYDRKALRAVNLQAADIMRAGEEVQYKAPVDIMPQSYEASKKAWVGPAKKSCQQPQNRASCKALASVLNESALIESLEWLLTGQANKPEQLEACKETHNCRFVTQKHKDSEIYRIIYVYNVQREKAFDPRNPEPEWECEHSVTADDKTRAEKDWASKGQCVAWDVNPKTSSITPVDATSTLAYRAIHPRI